MTARFLDAIDSQGGHVYEVGGCVRDRLMGRPIKDKDLLVTNIALDRLAKLLQPLGQVHMVGKSFGVIKFFPKESPEEGFDIALPRKEVSTGVGHRDFQVDYDPSLPVEIDLSRRDFTINAMAIESKSGRLIDPFGGERDLKHRLLKMVFDRAFEEDPLRLLRAVQFAARFHLQIEPTTFEAMKKACDLIRSVSPERVSEELRKLLTAEKPSIGFILMRDTGLLQPIFPELAENVGVEQGNKAHKDDVFLHTMKVLDASRKDDAIPFAGDLDLMLAALFHDVGKARTKRFDPEKNRLTFYGHQLLSKRMAKKRMTALKITTIGANPDMIAQLVEHHMFQTKAHFTDRSIRRFINKVGPDKILKLVDLRIADNRGGKYPEGIKGVLRLRNKIQDELDKKTPFGARDLAIRGDDLMAIGIPEGPAVGALLKELVEYVLDDPEINTKEALIDLATKIKEGNAPPKNEEPDDFAPDQGESEGGCEEPH